MHDSSEKTLHAIHDSIITKILDDGKDHWSHLRDAFTSTVHTGDLEAFIHAFYQKLPEDDVNMDVRFIVSEESTKPYYQTHIIDQHMYRSFTTNNARVMNTTESLYNFRDIVFSMFISTTNTPELLSPSRVFRSGNRIVMDYTFQTSCKIDPPIEQTFNPSLKASNVLHRMGLLHNLLHSSSSFVVDEQVKLGEFRFIAPFNADMVGNLNFTPDIGLSHLYIHSIPLFIHERPPQCSPLEDIQSVTRELFLKRRFERSPSKVERSKVIIAKLGVYGLPLYSKSRKKLIDVTDRVYREHVTKARAYTAYLVASLYDINDFTTVSIHLSDMYSRNTTLLSTNSKDVTFNSAFKNTKVDYNLINFVLHMIGNPPTRTMFLQYPRTIQKHITTIEKHLKDEMHKYYTKERLVQPTFLDSSNDDSNDESDGGDTYIGDDNKAKDEQLDEFINEMIDEDPDLFGDILHSDSPKDDLIDDMPLYDAPPKRQRTEDIDIDRICESINKEENIPELTFTLSQGDTDNKPPDDFPANQGDFFDSDIDDDEGDDGEPPLFDMGILD